MRFQNIELGIQIEAKGQTASLFHQVHGTEIIPLPHTLPSLSKADGAITSKKNFELYVFTADCMPVLFFGENEEDPIAAVHSGWRGTKDGILREATRALKEVKNLHVWVGPHIRNCCFEVKKDFLEAFETAGINLEPFLIENKFNLLAYAFATDLKSIPIQNRHLENAICTLCSTPALPSFRRQKSTDPRIRSWIKKI